MGEPQDKTYKIRVSSTINDIRLVFSLKDKVEEKSIVARFRLIPDEPAAECTLNLNWSDSLGSYFAYVPHSNGSSVVRGPQIKVPSAGTLEISYVGWPKGNPIEIPQFIEIYLESTDSSAPMVSSTLCKIAEYGENK